MNVIIRDNKGPNCYDNCTFNTIYRLCSSYTGLASAKAYKKYLRRPPNENAGSKQQQNK